jgi:hypothetical protein
MAIVIEGVKDLIVADIYPLARSPKDRGRAMLRITIPEGTVYHVVPDETRHGWVHTQVHTHAEGTVDITLEVIAPESYPLTMVCRWGADQCVVRGPCEERFHVLLDGVSRSRWEGYDIEHPGDPSRDPDWQPAEVQA